MSKILIGTPFKESAPDLYIKSLVDMIIYTQAAGHEIKYVTEHGGLYDARDRICARAMRGNYDYMLQIDSDMSFPPDALCRMLERNVDVISGVYVGKEEMHKPVLFTELHKDDENAGPYSRKHGLNDLMKEDLFTVAGTGAGFLLVREHILRIMKIHMHEWFRPYAGLGEDVSFCQRCTEMGIPVYADRSFTMGHIKYAEYTLEDWTGVEDEDLEKLQQKMLNG
jgi:hypothetical protein